jgi:hypothetical protein
MLIMASGLPSYGVRVKTSRVTKERYSMLKSCYRMRNLVFRYNPSDSEIFLLPISPDPWWDHPSYT